MSTLRHFSAAVLIQLSLLQAVCWGTDHTNSRKRPNLLIIHTDEQTFRSVSCYENSWSDLQTPNIDSLASKGARFKRFYTNHPVCSPSRAALLTGQYAQKVGTYTNDIPLDTDAVTIGDILKREGYTTGYGGKLHLVGATYPGLTPERNLGFDDNRYMFNNGHMKKLTVDESGRLQAPGGIGDEKSFTTDFLTDRTIEFIEKNKNNDWCYMVSIPDPHDPNTERAPYDSMFLPEDMNIPPTYNLPEGCSVIWEAAKVKWNTEGVDETVFLKQYKAGYYAMVTHIDDCVGRIIQHLDENDLLDNTIIVYTTDHGDMLGEFSLYDKSVFYEAAAKIPLIFHYPAKIQPNTVVDQVVSNVDFVPTILELMDIDYDSNSFDGRSAVELLAGKGDPDWQNLAFLSLPEDVGVVTDRYKLILRNSGEPWLIDLLNDPEELENAIDRVENQAVVKQLASQLRNYLESSSDPNWTDSLTDVYEQRYIAHKNFRPPRIQNAQKREVYWRSELIEHLNNLTND